MTYSSKYLTKELTDSAKQELSKLGQFSMLPIKLKAISACSDNQIKDVALIIGFSKRSIGSWIKAFKEEGVDGLLSKAGRGRKSLLSDDIRGLLKKSLESNPNITLKELSFLIKKRCGLLISKSTIHNYLKVMGYSHITSRPKHHKQDQAKLDQFKKNSNCN
jgi:transposase